MKKLLCDHIFIRYADPVAERVAKKEKSKYRIYKYKCSRCGKEMFIRTW